MNVDDLESLNRFEFVDSGISVRLDGDFSLLVDVFPAADVAATLAELSAGTKFFR